MGKLVWLEDDTPEPTYLPPTEQVYIPKRNGELCLFWSQDPDDALALVAGLCLTEKWPTVKRIHEAAALLEQRDDEGARRLAARLRRRTFAPDDYEPPRTPIPEVAFARNENKRYRCAWMIHPTANARCTQSGRYGVPSIQGTFCAIHVRFAVGKAKRKARAASKKQASV